MIFWLLIFLFPVYSDKGCSISASCGDGYCCKIVSGCACSHYKCQELCSHGDAIRGSDMGEGIFNGASSVAGEKVGSPENSQKQSSDDILKELAKDYHIIPISDEKKNQQKQKNKMIFLKKSNKKSAQQNIPPELMSKINKNIQTMTNLLTRNNQLWISARKT